MRVSIATVAALAALALTAGPAGAALGEPDGNGHPNVGGLLASEPFSDGTWTYCSGTLIAPRVFLTAAHCADADGESVRVSFDTAYVDGDQVYTGTMHIDPAYRKTQGNPHDIAVVILDDEVTGITPAQLPEADSLSSLSKSQRFTSVGYGAFEVTKGPHEFLYDDVRHVATGTLNSINKPWLRISQNRSHGDSGTCFGDSGGPNFLGTSDVIAAITITGDSVCRATSVDYRLDTAAARAFLAQYVALP